jgi:hypothetical protein
MYPETFSVILIVDHLIVITGINELGGKYV